LVETDDGKASVPHIDGVIGPEANRVGSAAPESAQQAVVEGLRDTREDENPAHARRLRCQAKGHADSILECEWLTAEKRAKSRRIAQTVAHIARPIPSHDLRRTVYTEGVGYAFACLNKCRRHPGAYVDHG